MSSEAEGAVPDFFGFDGCTRYMRHDTSQPGKVFALFINAEKSVFNPSASTKDSHAAAPLGPDIE